MSKPTRIRHTQLPMVVAKETAAKIEIHDGVCLWDEQGSRIGRTPNVVADMYYTGRYGEMEANARLFIASPVLLAAAEAVLKNWERGDLAGAVRDLADAVAQAKIE